MNAPEALTRVAGALAGRQLDEVEIFLKDGQSRRFELGPLGRAASQHVERGFAVRASGSRASLFYAGTGLPRAGIPWPAPDGFPLRLPRPRPIASWSAPSAVESPLLVESEGLELLEVCRRRLASEMPGARLRRAVLEDGVSACEIASTLGIQAAFPQRLATLYLEVVGSEGGVSVAELSAAREGRAFDPRALVDRLADRLLARSSGQPARRDRGQFLLAPRVGAQLLADLQPLVVGPAAGECARQLTRDGDLASQVLTVVDDPRLPGGVLNAPVDGEGLGTAPAVLIEGGRLRDALSCWWQRQPGEGEAPACMRRSSWRDLPQPAASNLYIEPAPDTPAATLLAAVTRGYYVLDTLAGRRLDLAADRFELPICGFEIRGGRSVRAISAGRLAGRVSALLRGIRAVGRDLAFFAHGAMVGAPSLLVEGIELREPR